MIGSRNRSASAPFAELRAWVRDEAGMALGTVMTVSAILFMLLTALLMLSNHVTASTQHQMAVSKATHMADAGLNAYLYELRRNPTYYLTNPTLGPTTLEDGTWTATVEALGGPGAPIKITSVGGVPSLGATRTVVAEVRFPTYADYVFLADDLVRIGKEATIDGQVRSNGDIENAGHITGKATAAGTVKLTDANAKIDGGYLSNQPEINFGELSADTTAMQKAAQAAGTYFNASTGHGFLCEFAGSMVNISEVTAINSKTGKLTTVLITSMPIPAEGLLYFQQPVWVKGTYSCQVTVCSADTLWIPDNLVPADPKSDQVLGLVAKNDILVPTWYDAMPENMKITAAMLSEKGSIKADMQANQTKTSLTILGALAYMDFGGFATTSGSTVTSGFQTRIYDYDERLQVVPPPMYPIVRDGSLKVATWFENR